VLQLPPTGPDYPYDAQAPGRKEQQQGIAAPVGDPRREQDDEDYAWQRSQKHAVVKSKSSWPVPLEREQLRR
jgi:hypothetical protein